MSIKRAISIRQPFVELILSGKKKFEYRSTPTNIRERVYIYASLSPGDLKQLFKTGKNFESLPKGRIVGSVEITDCKYDSRNDCYAYKLANPKRIRKVLKHKNQPSPKFWIPRF
jgi:hypothetical protein